VLGAVAACVLAVSSPATAAVTWVQVPTPDVAGSDFNQLLANTVVSPTEAWAVGSWRRADPNAINFQPIAERWTAGQGWRLVPTAPLAASADARFGGVAAVSANDVWAAGSSGLSLAAMHGFFEHWNGTAWQIVARPAAEPAGSRLTAIAKVGANDLWAVGETQSPDTLGHAPLAEHWNGSAWTVVPIPDLGQGARLFGVGGASAGDVWAVGDLFETESALVLHWNGTTWSRVPLTTATPIGESRLRAVTAVSGNDVWAVGQQRSGTRTLAAHWDGTAFTVANSPNVPSRTHSFFTAVTALASNDVWAVGSSLMNAAFSGALTEHWDGTAWTIVPNPGGSLDPTVTETDLLGVGGRPGGPLFTVGDRRPSADGYHYHTFAMQGQSG
jgi:hypothetical protein